MALHSTLGVGGFFVSGDVMNLSQIIDRCGTIMDFNPNISDYRNEVRSLVNMAYMEMFGDKPYVFAQKDAYINVYEDIQVTTFNLAGDQVTAAVGTPFDPSHEGRVFTIKSGAYKGDYVIRNFVSTTVINLDTIDGSSLVGVVVLGLSGIIKQRFVDFPEDYMDTLSLGLRQPDQPTTQPFSYITRWLDESLDLSLDEVSTPTDMVIVAPQVLKPPVKAPVLAAAGGTAPAGAGDYDVSYTFVRGGRESAPSPVSAFVTLVALQQVNLSAMQQSTSTSGLNKRIYLRGPESDAFYVVSNGDQTATTTALVNLGLSTEYLSEGTRLPEHEGMYQRFRLYPRQDQDYLLTLRYLFRPAKLIDDADAPIFPAEHHDYLVYRVCQELFVKHNNLPQSEIYRSKADRRLQDIENRYLTTRKSTFIKGHWRQTSMYQRPIPLLRHIP
jgi:hypothetical protein